MSYINLPISFVTLVKVAHFSYQRRNFSESMPFIAILINTLFVWSMTIFGVNDKFYTNSVPEWLKYNLLTNAFMVDSVGIFIYTWSFLEVVETNLVG